MANPIQYHKGVPTLFMGQSDSNPAAGAETAAELLSVTRNGDAVLLASAARTTTQTSADIINYTALGIVVILDLTAFTTAASLTVAIQGKDPASGKYYQIHANLTTVTSTGTYVYQVYPGIGAAVGGVTATAGVVLPRTFRIVVTHGNGNSHTYSVGYTLLG